METSPFSSKQKGKCMFKEQERGNNQKQNCLYHLIFFGMKCLHVNGFTKANILFDFISDFQKNPLIIC